MPNWCYNTLTISGEDEQVAAFVEKAKAGKTLLSFAAFVPEPEAECGDAWHMWRLTHWGCKWDASEVELEEDGDMAEYRFDTPWGPPIPWLEKVASDYPDLDFEIRFDEPSMEVHGSRYYSEGRLADGWDARPIEVPPQNDTTAKTSALPSQKH